VHLIIDSKRMQQIESTKVSNQLPSVTQLFAIGPSATRCTSTLPLCWSWTKQVTSAKPDDWEGRFASHLVFECFWQTHMYSTLYGSSLYPMIFLDSHDSSNHSKGVGFVEQQMKIGYSNNKYGQLGRQEPLVQTNISWKKCYSHIWSPINALTHS
jgi:hypothetical protein